MPAKGKHRRPKSLRLTRGFAVAGTGSAALALPLLGATGANAATPAAAPAAAPQAAHIAVKAAEKQAAKKAAEKAAPESYSVVSGDTLSGIAAQLDVDGGWKQLYEDNRKVVGGDPSLILPGQKLTVDGTKAEAKAAPKAPKAAEAPAKPAKAESASDTAQAQPEAAAGGFTAPVEASISTAYRTAGGMWASGYHTGTDFVVPTGTPIKAIGDGTVVSAGWSGSYGNEVVIRHADGHYSQYAHMTSLNVSSGQTVSGGQQIGLSGSTGNSTGPHLHFEVRTGPDYGSDVDPLAYLRSHGVTV
ncbi:LysM peptidoglycan-binding domain-containing M23 family metallopeptidase [Streptomyces sp. B-S-A8]|uniref:LysM peptidoglycan-binding domain-containing M23 family metallopeptidase n=1 Tax=Streptomyces solicavernae TaxID=3043614 RepID=A0ABT6RLY1_9ACTN|nr:LysM peptidoglycan-binding domain-containing M23 family metallopeptidase [Streptomyces sp. B-S-A8]MDI3385443.1 LysM peptidoglycan-binding domain-containing M23 family metallopeptidase [Streptomyces sp. B-S-A8]